MLQADGGPMASEATPEDGPIIIQVQVCRDVEELAPRDPPDPADEPAHRHADMERRSTPDETEDRVPADRCLRVARAVIRRVVRGQDVEDVTQEVMLRYSRRR